jgi:hypothetical protein
MDIGQPPEADAGQGEDGDAQGSRGAQMGA